MVVASILGLIWSIIPILGSTLPHHLEEGAGIPFRWAALLVSVLLGLMIVFAFALIGLVQSVESNSNE
jgi:ABC-type Mn2+/Zn2+ transport system permease subunit